MNKFFFFLLFFPLFFFKTSATVTITYSTDGGTVERFESDQIRKLSFAKDTLKGYILNSDTCLVAIPLSKMIKIGFTQILTDNPPVSNAGIDQTVNEGDLVSLDATNSIDIDGDVLKYTWTGQQGIIISDRTNQKPSFIAPQVTKDTQFSISLITNDGLLDSQIDQVLITVRHVNKIPIAKAGLDRTANNGSIVTLDGSASYDPDNDSLTYKWIVPSNVTISSTSVAKPFFYVPELPYNSKLNFILVVNDGKAVSLADTITVYTRLADTELVVTKNRIGIEPNPAVNFVNIIFNDIPPPNTLISVYDITGKCLLNKIVNNKEVHLDVGNLAKGYFFVKTNQDNEINYKLLIK